MYVTVENGHGRRHINRPCWYWSAVVVVWYGERYSLLSWVFGRRKRRVVSGLVSLLACCRGEGEDENTIKMSETTNNSAGSKRGVKMRRGGRVLGRLAPTQYMRKTCVCMYPYLYFELTVPHIRCLPSIRSTTGIDPSIHETQHPQMPIVSSYRYSFGRHSPVIINSTEWFTTNRWGTLARSDRFLLRYSSRYTAFPAVERHDDDDDDDVDLHDVKDTSCLSSFPVDDVCDCRRIDGWNNILLSRHGQLR
jgi:hypothetical protein